MTKEQLLEAEVSGFLEGDFKIYLNRGAYYVIDKRYLPKVLSFLESVATNFKQGVGGKFRSCGNYKGSLSGINYDNGELPPKETTIAVEV